MYKYNPAEISSRELPIFDRAVTAKKGDFTMWQYHSAKDLCKALINLPESEKPIYGFSDNEWQTISSVANGGIWPVPDTVYTQEDWDRDRTINAVAGQEIEETIYWHMFEVLPPYHLPRTERTAEYDSGFLVSEADSGDPLTGKTLYAGYGKKSNKFYYIGLIPSDEKYW